MSGMNCNMGSAVAIGDWVEVLRAECLREGSSQARVAKRMGVSAAVVNQILGGTYNGNLERMKGLVEGLLMGVTVQCPVVGEIRLNKCLFHQGLQFAATNPTRVALYRACRNGCPNSRIAP